MEKITKEQQQEYDEQCQKAFEELDKYYREIAEHNDVILKEFKVPAKDFMSLLDYSDVTGKMEVVEKPGGSNNHEKRGMFKAVWVDQWSVGMEGDSFEGFIYGKLADGKWLKVPYSC